MRVGDGFHKAIFSEVSRQKETDSISISPAAIYVSLCLAFMQAEGNTANEIHRTLELPGRLKADVQDHVERYVQGVLGKNSNSDFRFEISHAILFDVKHKLKADLKPIISADGLSTVVANVDFSDAEATLNYIDDWVVNSTAFGKIRRPVSKGDLSPPTTALILSTASFQAKWKHAFDRSSTQKREFFRSKSAAKLVDTMLQQQFLLYADWKELHAEVLVLPFEGMGVFMLIFLPRDIEGLDGFEASFLHLDFMQTQPEFKYRNVQLFLPKFNLTYEVGLDGALNYLGIKSLQAGVADFRPLLTTWNPVEFINVKHKTHLTVNEYGTGALGEKDNFHQNKTEATASNGLSFTTFQVDHPFMYMITDAATIFFVGHIRDL